MRSHVLAVIAVLVVVPRSADGQAFCSAPHSSPVLAGGGSITTLAPGTGWIQASALGQSSSTFFDANGDRRPYLAGGRVRTRSVYFTGSVGVIRGIDMWLQVPVHQLNIADETGERERVGIGDPRFSVRIGPGLVGVNTTAVAVRLGVKLPGTEFPVDPRIIPLSEGQRDWEVSLEAGRGVPGIGTYSYMMGWVGYRWRERNDKIGYKPGDEVFGHLAVGSRWRSFNFELATELMLGRSAEQFGLALSTAQRRLVQLQPTVGYNLGAGTFELAVLIPVAGKNLPTGVATSLGYRLAWGTP
ncbi:MAG: hypothetical protein JSW51_05915 [Gemmatimonadota bacterium]|nr:MAG: hypothetical protein JSW51_05915 [Gemmatimonadota bacterium]